LRGSRQARVRHDTFKPRLEVPEHPGQLACSCGKQGTADGYSGYITILQYLRVMVLMA